VVRRTDLGIVLVEVCLDRVFVSVPSTFWPCAQKTSKGERM